MNGSVFNAWLMRMERVFGKQTEHGSEPITAADLAVMCGVGFGVGGNRETQRRRIRALVERMREHGYRICAGNEGYWSARDDREWHAYQDARRKGSLFEFVRIAKMKTAANEKRSGQGRMF